MAKQREWATIFCRERKKKEKNKGMGVAIGYNTFKFVDEILDGNYRWNNSK